MTRQAPHTEARAQAHTHIRAHRAVVSALSAAALLLISPAAIAALQPGASAPDFRSDTALAGEAQPFHMAEALKRGPVVLYFYPKAFTSGCTVEAKLFADATPQFRKLGAEVIGMSNDTIDTLKQFSVEACRSQFRVGADAGGKVMSAYDAELAFDVADRISYAISPDGKVLAVHASMAPDGHVDAMLKAIEGWRAAHPN